MSEFHILDTVYRPTGTILHSIVVLKSVEFSTIHIVNVNVVEY